MSESVKQIEDGGFKEVISNGITLVDFWAPWCGPCRMQGPILEEVGKKVGEKADIRKLNVDENPVTAQNFSVSSIPTLILFKDGEVVNEFVGVQSEAILVSAIEGIA